MAKIPSIQDYGLSEAPRAGRGVPNIAAVGSGAARAADIVSADANRAGTGLGNLAAGASDFGVLQGRAEERIRQREYAVSRVQESATYAENGLSELTRLGKEADFSSLETMKAYGKYLETQRDTVLKNHKGDQESRLRLNETLERQRFSLVSEAGKLATHAQDARDSAALTKLSNGWAAQASNNPDGLEDTLALVQEEMAGFSKGLSPAKEIEASRKVRSTVIASAFDGYMNSKQFDKAEKLLKSGKYDEDLAPNVRERIIDSIDRGRKEHRSNLASEVRLELEDEIAAIRETGQGIGLSEGRIREAFGDKSGRVLKAIGEEREFFRARSTVALNSPEEDAALLANLKPEGAGFKVEAQRRDMVEKAVRDKRKALADDPAGYAVAASPAVRQALTEAGDDPEKTRKVLSLLDETQARLGVPDHLRRALPKSQAQALVSRITQTSAENAADAMDALSEIYGAKRWPAVYRDMVREKLPSEYRVLATVDNAVARKTLGEALKSEKEAKGALRKALGEDAKTIDETVFGELSLFRASLAHSPDGASVHDDFMQSAKLLAYKYAQSMSPADAARRATADLVNDRYRFVQTGVANARVPPGQERAAQDTAARLMRNLTAEDLPDPGASSEESRKLTPEDRKARLLSSAKRGLWVTNEDEDGWVLLDALRQPVLKADKSRVEFKFDDAVEDTGEAPATDDRVRSRSTVRDYVPPADTKDIPAKRQAPAKAAPSQQGGTVKVE